MEGCARGASGGRMGCWSGPTDQTPRPSLVHSINEDLRREGREEDGRKAVRMSDTSRAMKPTQSRLVAYWTIPHLDTNPYEGLNPTRPVHAAGSLVDPPVSEAIALSTRLLQHLSVEEGGRRGRTGRKGKRPHSPPHHPNSHHSTTSAPHRRPVSHVGRDGIPAG